LSKSTLHITKVIHYKYKDQFKCVNIAENKWYYFQNHRWNEDHEATHILMKMANEIADIFRNKLIKLRSSDEITKKIEKDIKAYESVTSQLENSVKRKHILFDCQHLFLDREFEDKLDSNHYLIGFNNGVYDLINKQFRDGRPDDYIKLTTGYNYEEIEENDRYYKEVEQFIKDILPDEKVREFAIQVLSSTLEGTNANEMFYIFHGKGRNGKSKLIKLMQLTFGQYACSIPIEILINNKIGTGEAPSPILLSTKNMKAIFSGEANKGDKFNMKKIKAITGGDEVQSRGMYSKEVKKFIITANIFLAFNDIPEIDHKDIASWDRVNVIEFLVKFVRNPIDDDPYQKRINIQLNDKLKDWKLAFFHLLKNNYTKDVLIDPPIEITKVTQNIKIKMNPIRSFIDDYIEETSESNDYICMSDLWKTFNKSPYQNKNSKLRGDFQMLFEEELGKKFDPNKKRYGSKQVTSHIHGYKLKDNEDEITNQSQVPIKLSENCLKNDN
jgi:Megaviricetes DNA primase